MGRASLRKKPVSHVSERQGENHILVPPVGDVERLLAFHSKVPRRPFDTLAAAAGMGDRGPGGAESRSWPWWAAASAAQVAAGVAWFRQGKGGAAVAMPFKAFAIASLFVGAGATAVAAGVSAAGFGSVEGMNGVGESVRRWMGAPPRRVGGE